MCDYIGSKSRFKSWITTHIGKDFGGDLNGRSVIDCCSGSGRITQALALAGAEVLAVDMLMFSNVMAKGSTLQNLDLKKAQNHINQINNLEGVNGFFYHSYCPNGNRMYFTNYNARMLDACRQYIESVRGDMKQYLLYCAIEALSRVQNTSGHQVSYLKEFKDRALKRFELRLEPVYPGKVEVVNGDMINVFKKLDKTYDAVYMDPPYNERQYGPNYHIYETFIRYDNPTIHGVTGLRDWQSESKSSFCLKQQFLPFLISIVSSCPSKKLFMSYNSDGLCKYKQIKKSVMDSGKCKSIKLHSKPVARYKQSSNVKTVGNLREYLFEMSLL